MVDIIQATQEDFAVIREIAYKTWPLTYGNILPKIQLDYMLGLFYAEETLRENLLEKGHFFLLAKEGDTVLGFASFVHHYQGKNDTHIHKIYILPEAQGKGVGKKLIAEMEGISMENHSEALTLNVNRFNNAREFYEKMGFGVIAEIDVKLDHGYLMEDYIMERKLLSS